MTKPDGSALKVFKRETGAMASVVTIGGGEVPDALPPELALIVQALPAREQG